MILYDKEMWLNRYGRITTYEKVANFEPCMIWTSAGELPSGTRNIINVKAKGMGDVAVNRLYDAVKNRLFELCQ